MIRQLEGQETRVETGPVQFGDDWPGVFIRGDSALAFRAAFEAIETEDPIANLYLKSMKELLDSSRV